MNPREDNFLVLPEIDKVRYRKYYEQMIISGKTKLFAQIYSEEMIDNKGNEFASYCFAKAYTKSIENGNSETYSMQFSLKYQELMVDNYSNLQQVLADPQSIYYEDKAHGFAKGMEYALENKISNIQTFADKYEKVYLNMVYASNIRSENVNADFEKKVLEKILNFN